MAVNLDLYKPLVDDEEGTSTVALPKEVRPSFGSARNHATNNLGSLSIGHIIEEEVVLEDLHRLHFVDPMEFICPNHCDTFVHFVGLAPHSSMDLEILSLRPGALRGFGMPNPHRLLCVDCQCASHSVLLFDYSGRSNQISGSSYSLLIGL